MLHLEQSVAFIIDQFVLVEQVGWKCAPNVQTQVQLWKCVKYKRRREMCEEMSTATQIKDTLQAGIEKRVKIHTFSITLLQEPFLFFFNIVKH